ncbi:hypothetical protein BDW72DRAFT_196701 [Aspergillus terricola var. indicus]
MSAENSKHSVKDKFKDVKGKFKRLWQRDDSTVGDPSHISQRSSRSLEAPATYYQEAHKLSEGKCDAECQDRHRNNEASPDDEINPWVCLQPKQDLPLLQNRICGNALLMASSQNSNDSSSLYQYQYTTKRSSAMIRIPIYDKTIECNDPNTNPDTVSRVKALSGVVETVKLQYQIDQESSKIKEPAQNIVRAVLNFQDFIQKAVAIDPTGHATSVWAIVSLGLIMTQNYRNQKAAWLESCAFLTDILTRYSFVEDEYRKDPTTDEHVEAALVQVYVTVLMFAAQVQSLYDRGRVIWMWKSIPGDSLSTLQRSIDEAELHLQKWLQIVDRREQRARGNRLLEVADHVLGSVNELHDKIDLAELKVAEEARYNAYTGEEYQECLPQTRTELLEDIKNWATDPDRRPVFWLQDNGGLLGGSFFFKKGGTDREDAKRLFTTLTRQIMERLPPLRQPIKEAIRTSRDIGSRNPQEQLNELLFKPLKSLNLGLRTPLILVAVIDALDECQVLGDVTAFLSTLPKLNDLKEVQLRVFITSRPEPPVIKSFQPIIKDEIILHQIKRSTIEHDISVFLQKKLDEIRYYHKLPQDWPGKENFRALVDMAVPLFICAATIYRFINCDDEIPDTRLQAILSSRSRDGLKKTDSEYVNLGDIYFPVLEHVVQHKKPKELEDWMADFHRIVGGIVLLFSPLSSVALAKLICVPKMRIQARLNSLQSVVSVPKDCDDPLQLLHLSFREFLVDHSAADKFWIDESAAHMQLVHNCLQCMGRELQRDICRLSHPGMRRPEIDKAVLERYVSPELRYACRYWIRHLENSKAIAIDWTVIEGFLKSHFLHWLEVMSLFGWVSETIQNITALQSLGKSPWLADFLHDAKRFILRSCQIADEAPLQIYCAGLVFAPRTAMIRAMFQSEIPDWIRQYPQVPETWSAELQALEGHTGSVEFVAFSPDDRLLASGSRDHTVRLWDPATGTLQQTLEGHRDSVYSVAFSHDGRLLASGSIDDTVRLWDPATGALLQTLEGHTELVRSVAVSSDGQLLASGSFDGTVRLWDPATGALRLTLEGHTGSVYSVAFSHDGRLLASGSFDETVRLWDPATGALKETLSTEGFVEELEFSQDNSYLDTNLGTFKVQSSCDNAIPNPPNMVPRISLQSEWIAVNGEQVLWLPPEARCNCSRVKFNKLALGHRSGRVSFLGFRI